MRQEDVVSIAVSARAATRLRSGHPWVYRSDLSKKAAGQSPKAELVYVTDERGRFIASALSSSTSKIALRAISRDQILLADVPELFRQRITAAISYRMQYVRNTQAYRLVFSEADQLPGLIIDRYNDIITVQFLTQAMNRGDLRKAVIDSVFEQLGTNTNIVERAESRIRQFEDLPPLESRILHGTTSKTIFLMNGISFHFDALAGQKSGAFLDQRENYLAAEKYAHGDALDVFCYQGGFALHLARTCAKVAAVDSSRAALEVADANAFANRASLKCQEIEWIEADAFELIKDYSSAGKQFDTIVLDPPAFAKNQRMLPQALRGYKELNVRALKMLRHGGILITNSCSHHVGEQALMEILGSAAADTSRIVKILENRQQSLDHPVIANIPETKYLKCLICAVA